MEIGYFVIYIIMFIIIRTFREAKFHFELTKTLNPEPRIWSECWESMSGEHLTLSLDHFIILLQVLETNGKRKGKDLKS